jgi:hypothetical protein
MFLVFASFLGGVHAQINEPSEEIYIVRPSETNPSIEHFDEPHYVISSNSTGAMPPPLVVFLAGTGGKPRNSSALLHTIAAQGYRVIGLEYNDVPAVVETCAKALTPTCSASFRNSRIFGDHAYSPVFTPPDETIVNRLCSLLLFLDREHPGHQWGAYMSGIEPNWTRIVIAGFSQGAGMAAYLAKLERVQRVVLFSSPWDYWDNKDRLAPWLAQPTATPPDRWYAEYHREERTAASIAQAYRLLGIPPENVLVFDHKLTDQHHKSGKADAYHLSTTHDTSYIPEWRILVGRPPSG